MSDTPTNRGKIPNLSRKDASLVNHLCRSSKSWHLQQLESLFLRTFIWGDALTVGKLKSNFPIPNTSRSQMRATSDLEIQGIWIK